jgi:hypothetical protein
VAQLQQIFGTGEILTVVHRLRICGGVLLSGQRALLLRARRAAAKIK